ncbi:DNA-3-methyladenine glycosylase 2 family protein [Candidatus Kaiserbacteria bacterium]|nr:DNA-3-methyladenine glycosylase 2 family protein [Candidatus Kaiserbacteria bacterium]
MKEALRQLSQHAKFAQLIKQHGPPKLRRGKNAFQALSRAIIYQQISGSAAISIYKKFVALFGIRLDGPIDWEKPAARKFPLPEQVLKISEAKMRSAGLSPQKIKYLKDLAKKFSDGTIKHKTHDRLTNDEIIAALTAVKGIGVWTAHMFLIFSLNRPDILPTGDLGIRKGFQILYKLRTLPDHKKMEKLAKDWREHASVASWYLWRVADGAKE